ncbi:MAG: neutral/alkaline non-lysosomal ceramidase N-terminal domain-containing protein [Planctomycetes bacterium]|nr:neutral/alkaline non-lysosomal ceramidase N-terminal domain-containing protein [Planctomycetota bacterium]
MKFRHFLLFALIVLSTDAALAEDSWKAGAAAVVITPPEPMWMSGYAGRDHAAEGKLTDLWTKALVLEDAEDRRVVLVTLDLVGIGRELSQSICRRLQERHELEREQIAICVSHTHTGPVVGRNLGPAHYLRLDAAERTKVDRYTDFLEEQIDDAVEQAMEKLAPAQLAWNSGRTTFAVNRRNNSQADVPELRAKGKLVGPVDYDVPVLAVRDEEGALTAVVFGYACHATVLSFYQWSGDYPGFAQLALEERRPGCIAMFWAGCGADQNPLPRRTVELAEEYGNQLADAVEETLDGVMFSLKPTVTATYEEINLPLAPLPEKEEIERDAQSDNPYISARAEMLLEQITAEGSLASTYPYPVQCWRLGDQVQWLFLGGEVVVDYALRLKSDLRGRRTWCAAYANDVMAYIPSRRVLTEGGYEGASSMIYYGLPTVWAPELEQQIAAEAVRQATP